MQFSYAASFTGTIPNYRYGIFCPFETGVVTSSTTILISYSFLPYINGRLPPSALALGWSNNDGLLSALNSNSASFS